MYTHDGSIAKKLHQMIDVADSIVKIVLIQENMKEKWKEKITFDVILLFLFFSPLLGGKSHWHFLDIKLRENTTNIYWFKIL